MRLALSRGERQQILTLSEAPNGEPNHVNHTETEFFLQRLDQMKIRLREANCRRFEFLVPDHSPFLQVQDSSVVAHEQLERGDSFAVSPCYRSAKNFH
jgi:hypothetical protein